MSSAISHSWTQEQFFAWSGHQSGRYELDGVQPVAMTGGTITHSRIVRNLNFALQRRLQGGKCEPLGPDAGVATVGSTIRYADALVTCSKQASGNARTVEGVVAVFEVVSPTSGRTDRIVKFHEYGTVASIQRYVIIESTSPGATVLDRAGAEQAWNAKPLMSADDILDMPEIGIQIPLQEIYTGVDFGIDPEEQDASGNAGARG